MGHDEKWMMSRVGELEATVARLRAAMDKPDAKVSDRPVLDALGALVLEAQAAQDMALDAWFELASEWHETDESANAMPCA